MSLRVGNVAMAIANRKSVNTLNAFESFMVVVVVGINSAFVYIQL
jgi:hypothetical protein